MERVHRSAQRLALFVTLGLVLGSTAQAISIVGVAATTNPGDSGSVTTLFGDIEGDSFASVRNAGGSAAETVGATVTAGTRYAQYLWADNTTGTSNGNSTANYSVAMTIIPDDSNTIYDLQIDTTRLGSLTLVDDSTFWGCCFSSANVGAVSATLDGAAEPGLAMGALGINSSPTDLDIDQAANISIVNLTGTYNLILNFAWEAAASSNNDEGAVRLGLGSTTFGVSADDYPGVGGRILANDGHFVDVTATVTSVIPEPTTGLLVGLGLAALVNRRVAKR
jgi:hypothetical protein